MTMHHQYQTKSHLTAMSADGPPKRYGHEFHLHHQQQQLQQSNINTFNNNSPTRPSSSSLSSSLSLLETMDMNLRKRRAKSLLLLSALSFVALLIVDAVLQLTPSPNDPIPQQSQQSHARRMQRTRPPLRLPLLPRHSLQHRQRRELYRAKKPLPLHLRDDQFYHAPVETRRRRTEQSDYETGSLYQGYGTHYLDLWVGTPPQRQTVIIDTGSSITAFPCTGCQSCGSIGDRVYHLDPDFDRGASDTFRENGCVSGVANRSNVPCRLGTCVGEVCELVAAYAEGSSWRAVEGEDVVYPAGPHGFGLEEEEREGYGVGTEWGEFRLTFGCQHEVTGLFRTQLEDGIMGMDNRKGSFWRQLRDYYKTEGNAKDDDDPFDPAQFSLCYNRQPISSNMKSGVESGSLTIGGSDPILHGTPMVFAENLTPMEGWFTVRIKGIFLRTNGGTLAHPPSNSTNYIRVDAEEDHLNGNAMIGLGPIIDSGTTDTYLSILIQPAFQEAWKEALQNPDAPYNNHPITMTPEQVTSLPTVLVVFQGHTSNVPDHAVGMVGHPSHQSMLQPNPNGYPNPTTPNDVLVAIPPEHYMEESSNDPGTFTSRLYFTEPHGARSILGSNFLMGHEVLFDNTAGRMGFAESHCDYERYVEERAGGMEDGAGERNGGDRNASDWLGEGGWSRRVQQAGDIRIPG